jgi:hypothetical protein
MTYLNSIQAGRRHSVRPIYFRPPVRPRLTRRARALMWEARNAWWIDWCLAFATGVAAGSLVCWRIMA